MIDPRAKRAFATEVAVALRNAGFQSLWAGGCVRDLLLGMEPADYDVATDATPEQVMAIFRRTIPVGVSFGVVRVLGPREAGEIEVATFRSDLAYVDGRRPEGVVFGSPELDAQRRDFTINGMFLDPLSGEVIDLVGGRVDLDARLLRAIGDPFARFSEDKLRLIRAVRFAARFDMTIEPATRAAMVAMADQVRVVAAERIAQELRKMIVPPSRCRAMRLMMETGLSTSILPDLVRLRTLPAQSSETHSPDAWDRTLRALAGLPDDPGVTLAMAVLLHAVGMPGVAAEVDGNRIVPGHESLGAEIAGRICNDLRVSNAERERITWLIAHQDALRDAERMPRSRLKRLLAEPGIDELLMLHQVLSLATNSDSSHVDYFEMYIRDEPEGPIDPPPLLTGYDLKSHGLKPGPRFKSLLEAVRNAQLEGRLADKAEALRWVSQALEGSDDEPSA